MNILVPDSWLREHLQTKATPKQIARYLSLCSQSVEKLIRKDNDFIYNIEVTTNRADCLSVYGIARELAAILPNFGLPAKLRPIKETKIEIPSLKTSLPLTVKIENHSLCPRFTAIIFDQVKIKPSPQIVRDRLEKAGVRALNNVVDISNYLMLELGQPMHTFDYDKIKGTKMILREAAGGEKITTLDGQTRPLPEKTIIIEDGQGRIIDLCGIMGGANSQVDQETKRVLLFVQTYDPARIRQTCQALAFRTEASSRFEKGVEPQGVLPAIKKAVVMFRKLAGAKTASNLIDFYPRPLKTKKVSLTKEKLNRLMGLEIKLAEAKKILESLGFSVQLNRRREALTATVPYWRYNDISLPEDLVEEIARLYGYHRLPSLLPGGTRPQRSQNPLFTWEERIRDALKFWGFTETASYSLVSRVLLKKTGFQPKNHLKITNPLTEDLVYLRQSLLPSLLAIIAQNQPLKPEIKIFELANVYLPLASNQLPEEKPRLAGIITPGDFSQIKGTVEAILEELGIRQIQFKPGLSEKISSGKIFPQDQAAKLLIKNRPLGVLGEVEPLILRSFQIKNRVFAFELEFFQLAQLATTKKSYLPIPKYPAVIEDLAFTVSPRTLVGEIIQLIKAVSPIIQRVELWDSYQNTRTFRITYQSHQKNLSEKEIQVIREKIIQTVGNKLGAKLKQKTS